MGEAGNGPGQTQVSIIMPAYNAERTIRDAVNSVIGQTFENWELLVIDDGSGDSTYNIIKEASAADQRVRAMRNNKNLGVSETRNRGVSCAGGGWIAFLDSDDMWKPEKLEKQLKLAEIKRDAALIFTGSSFINADGSPTTYSLAVPEQTTYRKLLKQNIISCSSVLVKKELVQKFRMKHDNMHEDFAVWLQILKDGFKAYGIDEPLLVYRISTKSKSGNKIKAAKMTYSVYRHIGLTAPERAYYLTWYGIKNIIKYNKIKAGFNSAKK